MKVILFILLVIQSLNLIAGFKFNDPSDIELSMKYSNKLQKTPITVEDFCYKIISLYGIDEYHNMLNAIENNKDKEYLETLKKYGNSNKYDDIYSAIACFDYYHLSFVANNKLYVLSYDLIKNQRFVFRKSTQIVYREIYLFFRDDYGWHKASDLIRTDFQSMDSTRQFFTYTVHGSKNDNANLFEFYGFSSITKLQSNNVLISFDTFQDKPTRYSYISLLVLMPSGNGYTYNFALLNPINLTGKVIENARLNNDDGSEHSFYLPVLYGSYSIDYREITNGVIIQYWDWNYQKKKPYLSGVVNLLFKNNDLMFGGTIELNRVGCVR